MNILLANSDISGRWHPQYFALAITYAIYGDHFRKEFADYL